MDAYPLNLILAVATACATIFIGFLPTKTVSSKFFARQTALAIFAWAIVAFTSPTKIIHFLLMLAFFSFASWWHFNRDRALNGKMWLSLASGLGISIGVMLILKVTPQALPSYPYFMTADALSDPRVQMENELNETSLLASIYLGGAVIGLAYVLYALLMEGYLLIDGTRAIVRRYSWVLVAIAVARGIALLVTNFRDLNGPVMWAPGQRPSYIPANISAEDIRNLDMNLALLLGVLVIPIMAILVKRAVESSNKVRSRFLLVAICLSGFFAEILARWELL